MQQGRRANTCIRGVAAAPLVALTLALFGQTRADFTGWAREDTIPIGAQGKSVKDGGALTYCPKPGAGCLYALKGNNTNEFYRYDIADRAWAEQKTLPPVGISGTVKRARRGAALTCLKGRIYATKGNNTNDLFRFDPQARSDTAGWSLLAGIPSVPLKEGAGLAAVRPSGVGSDTFGSLYLLKGSNTNEFWRYDVGPDTWLALANAPHGISGRSFKNGSCIAYDGDGHIFALKASYDEFYCYSVVNDSWSALPPLPMVGVSGTKKKVKDGAGLAVMGGVVFALKGNNTDEFWAYEDGRWRQNSDIPLGGGKCVKGGGALTAGPDCLYALKGNGSSEFYSFAPIRVDTTGSDTTKPQRMSVRVGPSPTPGTFWAACVLPSPGLVSARLYDASGRLAATVARGNYPAGNLLITADVSRLPRGAYVFRIAGGQDRAVAGLVLE